MSDLTKRFMKLFNGYEYAHGQYRVQKEEADGKMSGRAITMSEPASQKNFEEHLRGGEYILGIIMLKQNNSCNFGVVDVDIRGDVKLNESLESLEKKIRDTPLVLCRSKSGGAHLYLFCEPAIAAIDMVSKLNEFAAQLGYGGAEIFPKQISRANERDRGNWINLCYWDGDKSERHAIHKGKKLNLSEFINLAEKKRTTFEKLESYTPKLVETFNDGPPCLQHILTMGFPEGGRNISLFNVGVYYRKKNPDDWQEDLMKFNYEHVSEPLPASEVNGLVKAVSKKDYAYTCKQTPICNYCEKSKCMKRDYGVGSIGGGGASIEVDAITKYETENRSSVRWYIEMQGERIEITTQQLLDQKQLQKICVEKLNKCPSTMPAQRWEQRINELLSTVEVVQDPDDASPQGQFEKILDLFVTGKVQARQKDEIMNGKPWHSSDEGKVYFRSEDLFIFLEARRFRYPSQHQVWSWLRNLGGDRKAFRIKSKPVKVWSVPSPDFYDDEDLTIPSSVEEDF
jgi:hypothetical protein|tara:strand:+ start:207 stop:1742 length:1536 start_codon:yes stop_codon:yes gene_type:complete